jgi:TonB-linked SusC/RagA family outer membrane protein
MKLTVILLVAGCLHVSANGYSQTVSFSGRNVPLQTVFSAIEKQTGISFFFNYTLIKDAKPVTLDLQDVPMEEALREALKGQELDFYETGKTVFIIKKQVEVSSPPIPPAPPPVEISGTVRAENGEPLAGATVSFKRINKSSTTNEKGSFVLKNVPNGMMTLEVSFVGYEKYTTDLDVSRNINDLNIQLRRSKNSLDEVQIVAYGTTTQRLNTGDVTTVKGSDIDKLPIDNPLLALEGRVAGLFVSQATGLPGSGASVLIQGQNSIGNGNDPFYVIDGVPYTSQLLPNLGTILQPSSATGNNFNAQNGNPFSFINPADIESISVLKDADATAIYGSRAANGAILITTKKGKIGQSKVDINVQNGWGKVTRRMDLLNLKQYLAMRREALRNDGIVQPSPTDYDINGFWDTTRSTDWQKTLMGNTAQFTQANATFSGGNALTQYLVGGTFNRQTTVFPGSFSDKKGTLHFNLNTTSTNQKLKVQLSGSYQIDNNQLPSQSPSLTALYLPPNAPKLYNPDGTLNWMPNAAGSSTWTNPLTYFKSIYQNKTNNLISNVVIDYAIVPGLNIKSNFGYTNLQSNEIVASPLSVIPPEYIQYLGSAGRSATYGYNSMNSWIIEPQINFNRELSKGKLEALLGSTIQQNSNNGLQLGGNNYNSDAVLKDIRSAAVVYVNSTYNTQYKYSALFGRLNYNWQDKYIANLTVRRDGTSRFGTANEYHTFGAMGAAWLFSNESFLKEGQRILSFGKLRTSYGTTGNDQITDYSFLSLYTPTYNSGIAYQGVTGLEPKGLSNPYLQWEETKKLQIGVETGFFKDRILLNINYFDNRSNNQLLSYQLPIITGFNSIARNFPATVQNTGWEFTLHTVNIKLHDFSWQTNFNLTLPSNKLISFPNLATSSYAQTLVIGQPVEIIKTYKLLGVNPATGGYLFADNHGNPTPNPNYATDQNTLVDALPKYYGGFENHFQYKGFDLTALFQFSDQKMRSSRFGNYPGSPTTNQPTSVLDRWQKSGDITPVQRYNSNGSLNSQAFTIIFSDAIFDNASYVRLKTLALSYSLPAIWVKRARLQYLRVYLQGQNLLTFTRYSGLDPETGATTLPPLKMLTTGIQIGL